MPAWSTRWVASSLQARRWNKARPVCSNCVAVGAILVQRTEMPAWQHLKVPVAELLLKNTLPVGQSFRWRKSNEDTYLGVIGHRLVEMQQLHDDVRWRVVGRTASASSDKDQAVMHDYFNLNVKLCPLVKQWRAADPRFAHVSDVLQGCRMLRQDPVETLFAFICSANNHISRIQGMVEYLCQQYGSPIPAAGDSSIEVPVSIKAFTFPTLKQLSQAAEQELRENGFGYRARYVVETIATLNNMECGGRKWLESLRELPFQQVVDQLTQLSGVGPKVAACIALFACDKHEAIPVDTHVWTLAQKYYVPSLKGKTLSPKLHPQIMQAFIDVFGPYAGWAHNYLFVSELASHRDLLNGPVAKRERVSELMSTPKKQVVKLSAPHSPVDSVDSTRTAL